MKNNMEIKEQSIGFRILCILFSIGLIILSLSGMNGFNNSAESVATVISAEDVRWEYDSTNSTNKEIYYTIVTVKLLNGEIAKYTHTSHGYCHLNAGDQVKVTIYSDGTVGEYQSPETALGGEMILIVIGISVLYMETIGYSKARKN